MEKLLKSAQFPHQFSPKTFSLRLTDLGPSVSIKVASGTGYPKGELARHILLDPSSKRRLVDNLFLQYEELLKLIIRLYWKLAKRFAFDRLKFQHGLQTKTYVFLEERDCLRRPLDCVSPQSDYSRHGSSNKVTMSNPHAVRFCLLIRRWGVVKTRKSFNIWARHNKDLRRLMQRMFDRWNCWLSIVILSRMNFRRLVQILQPVITSFRLRMKSKFLRTWKKNSDIIGRRCSLIRMFSEWRSEAARLRECRGLDMVRQVLLCWRQAVRRSKLCNDHLSAQVSRLVKLHAQSVHFVCWQSVTAISVMQRRWLLCCRRLMLRKKFFVWKRKDSPLIQLSPTGKVSSPSRSPRPSVSPRSSTRSTASPRSSTKQTNASFFSSPEGVRSSKASVKSLPSPPSTAAVDIVRSPTRSSVSAHHSLHCKVCRGMRHAGDLSAVCGHHTRLSINESSTIPEDAARPARSSGFHSWQATEVERSTEFLDLSALSSEAGEETVRRLSLPAWTSTPPRLGIMSRAGRVP